MGWREWQNAKGPGLMGSPQGPPASELKTLKMYVVAKYNYLKILIYYVFFI
jgi:hypothetical protein